MSMARFVFSTFCVLFAAIVFGVTTPIAGQTDEWREFENTVLQLAGNVVDIMIQGDAERYEIRALERRITALESLLALHIQQHSYPLNQSL